MKIMIVTVGGSHQPIVRSIKQNKPDMAHFLCSADSGSTKGSYLQVTGEGKVLKSDPKLDKPDLPNIVSLTGLRENQYEVHRIAKFDDLEQCYLAALELIEKLHADHPQARIIVDYTGGTKSMAVGLAAAALDDGRCEIQLVTGLREDLHKVSDKTEFVRPVQVGDAQAKRRMKVAGDFISRFDYSGAAHVLEDAAARFASDKTVATLQRWLGLCRAFDAWDRFDHASARDLLRPFRKNFVDYARFLDAILDGKAAHGFELVEDLLLNAERRAGQGRYDDAIGRLYRALELMAQRWLEFKHGITTGNVELDLVPEEMKEKLQKVRGGDGVIRIGLLPAWDLISSFPNDTLGAHFSPQRGPLMNFLQVRNYSLFAHGVTSIGEREYRAQAAPVKDFLRSAINIAISALNKKRVVALPQLPTKLE